MKKIYELILFTSATHDYVDPIVNFIEKELEPFSSAYNSIKKCSYEASQNADKVNELLRWLNRIANSDWIPPAMLYYVKNHNNPQAMHDFLEKLERLAAFMNTDAWNVNDRIERYAKVLKDIESSSDEKFGNSINLTEEEKETFIKILNSDLYTMKADRRNYLILRLDTFISDGSAEYTPKTLTIEHVLPQTVAEKSEWEKTWPDVKDRETWCHKIGNLIPLSKRKNSEAQNYN